jgi:antitoxin component of RelBE/YafQ-DinJ toxin-antitoxin module
MTEKSMVSAKIAERTKERLDEYADREGISRSQVIDRMLKQGLDVENGDVKVVPVDQGTNSGQGTNPATHEARQSATIINLIVVMVVAALVVSVIDIAIQLGVI